MNGSPGKSGMNSPGGSPPSEGNPSLVDCRCYQFIKRWISGSVVEARGSKILGATAQFSESWLPPKMTVTGGNVGYLANPRSTAHQFPHGS
jgi:hypothetical protein